MNNEKESSLEPGDFILFFTEVLMEMQNPEGVPWGPQKLIAFVQARRSLQPTEIRDELVRFAKKYTGADSFDDDFTLMVLKRENQ